MRSEVVCSLCVVGKAEVAADNVLQESDGRLLLLWNADRRDEPRGISHAMKPRKHCRHSRPSPARQS